MIKAILFDLDGTLLPMDQDTFVGDYLNRMTLKMHPHGYEHAQMAKAVWAGTGAMTLNDGTHTNEEVFWRVFSGVIGKDARADESKFLEFYETEFQQVRHSCGYNPRSFELIRYLKDRGFQLILATNPLFPAVATRSRVRWAGLNAEDFDLITTYENSRHCKPNPEYYRDILETMNLKPEECLMVGNDVAEDMVAETLGLQVFLLTDCLINKNSMDINRYPHGDFFALIDFVRRLQ